jgi:hypothetical protein
MGFINAGSAGVQDSVLGELLPDAEEAAGGVLSALFDALSLPVVHPIAHPIAVAATSATILRI